LYLLKYISGHVQRPMSTPHLLLALPYHRVIITMIMWTVSLACGSTNAKRSFGRHCFQWEKMIRPAIECLERFLEGIYSFAPTSRARLKDSNTHIILKY
jgi:hypothetical protein